MEWISIFVYLFVLAVFAVLGGPIAALFFRALPRRGAAFALPTALIPFTIVVFWVGQFTFGVHTLVVGVAVVFAGAVAANRSGISPEWRSVAAMYGVFAVGFSIMVVFRAADPGLTPAGGEQFLHFGLVNAIERANSLPPEDVWFAGRPLRYYYGTQLQVTSLSMLTGTPLRYGFNLGIATFYGILFVVAYGVCGGIVRRRGHSYRLGGVFGAFFVTLAGPTTTAIRLATPYLPDVVAGPTRRAAFGFVADRFYDGNLTQAVAELSNPFEWTWWHTRYVVPGTIQEVPLYSFIKADLHGHTFANGYVLFAGALAFAYYLTPAEERLRRGGLVFGGLGAVAGLFGFMNTWSLPTVAGLAVLAVAAADSHPATLLSDPWGTRLEPSTTASTDEPIAWLSRELWRLVLATVAGVVVLLVGIVVASPFLVFGQIPTNDGIGIFPPRSPLDSFLVIYAGFLAIFALYVVTCGWPAIEDVPNRRLAVGGLVLFAALVVTAVVFDFGVLAVVGPLVVAGWLLVRSDRGEFGLVLLIAGVGLVLSFEVVHARLPLVDNPRWNTSLKVAVQGWTLGAVGVGAATAVLLARAHERLVGSLRGQTRNGDGARTVSNDPPNAEWSARHETTSKDDLSRATSNAATLRSLLTVALVVVILLASAVFPIMASAIEIGGGVVENRYDPSLDGFNTVQREHANESDALLWLRDRPGHPTVVEAPGESYQWTTPAASFSGLPGVIGWDHQAEYRSPEAYTRRVNRVDTIYTGERVDAARNLERYDVTYIYVGPNERERYGEALRPFDHEAFTVAFEADAVRIYRVDQSALSLPEERRSARPGGPPGYGL